MRLCAGGRCGWRCALGARGAPYVRGVLDRGWLRGGDRWFGCGLGGWGLLGCDGCGCWLGLGGDWLRAGGGCGGCCGQGSGCRCCRWCGLVDWLLFFRGSGRCGGRRAVRCCCRWLGGLFLHCWCNGSRSCIGWDGGLAVRCDSWGWRRFRPVSRGQLHRWFVCGRGVFGGWLRFCAGGGLGGRIAIGARGAPYFCRVLVRGGWGLGGGCGC